MLTQHIEYGSFLYLLSIEKNGDSKLTQFTNRCLPNKLPNSVFVYLTDKIIVQRWPLLALLEQYTVYSVSVSAMEILFSSGNPTK